jgi:hypothetical protein
MPTTTVFKAEKFEFTCKGMWYHNPDMTTQNPTPMKTSNINYFETSVQHREAWNLMTQHELSSQTMMLALSVSLPWDSNISMPVKENYLKHNEEP